MTILPRAAVADLPEDQPPPWEAMAADTGDARHSTAHLLRQVAGAAAQVLQAGSDAQVKEAGKILTDARKALYRLLAEDEPEAGNQKDDQ